LALRRLRGRCYIRGMRKTLRYVVCDVFTDRPLEGNALAVFTDARAIENDPATMQAIAREMNLSETTFVLRAEQGGHARARIFTPRLELAFAGHPTLGTAYVLAAPLQLPLIRLELAAGIVPVRFEGAGQTASFGWMSQPLAKVEPVSAALADGVLGALGVAKSTLPIELYDNGNRHVYVGLDSPQAVAACQPDLVRLGRATTAGVVIFAARSPGELDVRVFHPNAGVAEDPATGSAAGPLGWHLVRHGQSRAGEQLRLAQGAQVGRPSTLYVRIAVQGDRATEIEVGGHVVSVARGEFVLP
jgi:trans-2,3-dihydro-3-hydroxyanthranilate isomerase